MKFIGNIDLDQNLMQNMVLDQLPDFPLVPKKGQVVFKGMKLYMCVDIVLGAPVWIALTNELNSFIFTQGTPASTWSISHVSDDNNVIVQVYDAANKQMIPNDIDVSVPGVITIDFGSAQAGHAVVVYRVKGQAEPVPEATLLGIANWNGEGGPELKITQDVRPGNMAAISPTQFILVSEHNQALFKELLMTAAVTPLSGTGAINDSTVYTIPFWISSTNVNYQGDRTISFLGSDIQTWGALIDAANTSASAFGVSVSLSPAGLGIIFKAVDPSISEIGVTINSGISSLTSGPSAISQKNVSINSFSVNPTSFAITAQSSVIVSIDDLDILSLGNPYVVSLDSGNFAVGLLSQATRLGDNNSRYYIQKASVDAGGNISLIARSSAIITYQFISNDLELSKISNTLLAIPFAADATQNSFLRMLGVSFVDVSASTPTLVSTTIIDTIDTNSITVGDYTDYVYVDFCGARVVSADRLFYAATLRAVNTLDIDPYTRTTTSEIRAMLFDTSLPSPAVVPGSLTSVFNTSLALDDPFEIEAGLPGTVVISGTDRLGVLDLPVAIAFTVSADSISASSYAAVGVDSMYYYHGLVHAGDNQFILAGDVSSWIDNPPDNSDLKSTFCLFKVQAGEIVGIKEVTDFGTIFPNSIDDVTLCKLSDTTFVISHSKGLAYNSGALRVQNLA